MESRFEKVHSREGTWSRKWDGRKAQFGTQDILPLWVADMDFKAPEIVKEALIERVNHGIFGYVHTDESVLEAICSWFERRHGWSFKKEDIVFTPALLPGISMTLEAFSKPGDGVVIQPPVYPPFAASPIGLKRKLLENCLKETQPGHYEMDLDNLEDILKKERPSWLILCNPHNPVGRIWTEEELLNLAKLCARYNVGVISDEIHGDLALGDRKYIPFAKLASPLGVRVLTGAAASKTFNIPGLTTAFWIVPDEKLRLGLVDRLQAYKVTETNLLGLVATKACYTHGEAWLDELKQYLFYNAYYVNEMLNYHAPGISANFPEATYLSWVDCRQLGLTDQKLQQFFVQEAKVGLNSGISFGNAGSGFMRLNFGCPRSTLRDGLERIVTAARDLRGWRS